MTEIFDAFINRVSQIEIGLGLDKELDYLKIDDYQEITKAYILLVHAEIEKYFEIISAKIVRDSLLEYKATGKINKPLLSLLSSDVYSIDIPKNFDDNKGDLKLDDRVGKFVGNYNTVIYENNGIKENNVFKLLWKLGFTKADVGETLLSLLDDYGSKRGSIAHTGTTYNKQLLNYSDEKTKVNTIKAELEKFDDVIENYNYLSKRSSISDIENLIYTRRT